MNPDSAFIPTIGAIIRKWLNMPGFRRYSKNVGWSLLAKVVSLIVSFFTTIYVVRSLGPDKYGLLSYAVSFVGVFSFVATLGIDQVLYRELVRFPEKTDELLGTSCLIRLIAGCAATLLCIGTAYLLPGNDDISLFLICIISITFIFNAAQNISYEFQAKVESKYLSIIAIVTLLILNALKVLTIFFNKGVIYLAFILLLEAVLGTIFLSYARWKYYGSLKSWTYNKKTALLLIRDAWPMILASAFTLVYSRIDQVFIKHLIDTPSVGLYSAAVQISEIWYFIPTVIVSTFFPALVNAKIVSGTEYTKRLAQSALLLAGLSVLVSIPVTLFAWPIIYIIYGSKFLLSAPVLQIYVWSSVPTALGSLATSYLIAENFRKTLFVSSCLTMVLNVILNILLIPHYGIIGSAWATFFSYMAVPASLLLFTIPRQQIIAMFKVKDIFHSQNEIAPKN